MKRIHSIEIARFYQRIENAENKKAKAKQAKAKKSFLRRLFNVWQNEEYHIFCIFHRLDFICFKHNEYLQRKIALTLYGVTTYANRGGGDFT